MNKPFKFRYVNEIVGVFVLLVVALLVVGILATGRAQGWFESTHEIRAVFPQEGSMGLRRGSEIRVLDTPAGTVLDIEPREDGVMEGVFEVRDRFIQYIRDDSTGVVSRVFGVAGDAYLEITRGRGAPLPTENAYIPVVKDTELLDLAQSLLEEVRENTVPAIEQLQILLDEHTALARELRDPEGDTQQLLHTLNTITQGLEAGEGAAGKLLRDPAVAAEVEQIIAVIQDALIEVDRILFSAAEAVEQLPRMTDRLAGELEDVPGLIYQTQATLQEAEVLISGIQRHWLIRRHIQHEGRGNADRLAPSVLAGTGGAP